jgi:hypothetical protein
MIKPDHVLREQLKLKRRIKMPKKNQEQLEKLQDAVSRFKKVKEQDPGDNEIFSKYLDSATLKLLNKMHEVVSQKFTKPSKSLQTKTEKPELIGTSTIVKVNEKDGKPK